MKIKCIVKGCENHKNEGGFEDGMCLPCYLFITTGEGIYSQAYRNSKPVELTDEEIHNLMDEIEVLVHGDIKRAMYRMARKVESILNE